MMKPRRDVSKAEFNAALDAYSGQLEQHVVRICEPPMICLMDWSLPSPNPVGSIERFDDCLIAGIYADWMGPNGELDKEDHRRFWRYWLCTAPDPLTSRRDSPAPTESEVK